MKKRKKITQVLNPKISIRAIIYKTVKHTIGAITNYQSEA
jgi:hypothetical protein